MLTPSLPGGRRLRWLVLLVGLLAGGILAGTAQAGTLVPCTTSGAHHDCRWRVPGNGKTGGAPVLAANGSRVGYLHQGTNWVLCQRTGRRDHDGRYFNDVWGYTTADNGRKGWVNALWAHGGGNDSGFSGTPQCAASYGTPPTGASTPPKPSPKPSPDSCAHTRENQTATISFSYLETRRHVILPGNVAQPPASKDDAKPKHHGFGTITVGGGTCKSPTGWRALKNVSIHEDPSGLYKDGGGHASIKGSGSAKGWGFGIAAARDGSLDVQQTACRKGSGWAIVKALVSLPIKGLPYVGSLAKFAVGKLIPSDGTKCDDMGVARISLSADRNGRLVVESAALSQGGIVQRTYDDPHETGDYHEHSRVPDPPRIAVRTR